MELKYTMRAYSQPGALRGAFNDYRAGPEDVVQDEEDEGVLMNALLLFFGEKSSRSAARCGTFARFGKRWHEIHRFSRYPSVATFRTRKNHRKSTQRCSSFSKSDKTEDER